MCLGEVGRVAAIDDAGSLVVESEKCTSTVSGLLLDATPQIGDWVLIHAGFALGVLTDGEARDVLAIRAQATELS